MRVYKDPRCHSFSDDTMTTDKYSEEDFKKIVEEIRNELTYKLAFLDRIEVEEDSLPRKFFVLEFFVVSPLYYRLLRHLIDWGTRTHHPHLSDLKLTQQLDGEGKRYYDKFPPIPGDKDYKE